MTQERCSSPLVLRSRRARVARRLAPPLVLVGVVALACSDDEDDDGGLGGSAGSGGEAGSAMSSGGSGGQAGSAGGGGAGSGGEAGGAMAGGGMGGGAMAGAAGMPGDAGVVASGGGTGVVEVLSDDQAALLGPTTAAIVDDTVWVPVGQLAQLFSETPNPSRPFQVVGIPLAGGAVLEDTIEFLPLNTDFYPEGIAADADGRLYAGSIVQGLIGKVDPGTTELDPFMAPGVAERGVIGMAVDAARDILWFCDSSPVAAEPGGALVGISLLDPNADDPVRHALPDNVVQPELPDAGVDAGDVLDAGAPVVVPPFCNDVIVLPEGDLLISDSSGRIFRVAAANAETPNSAEVWLSVPEIRPPEPEGFGVNGLDLVGGQLIVANGNLVQVDPNSEDPASTVRVLTLSEAGAPASLCGPDGLAAVPGTDNQLVVVENGFCPSGRSRVVKVTLDLN